MARCLGPCIVALSFCLAFAADSVDVRLSGTPRSAPFLPNFVGFSIEVPSAPVMLGPSTGAPRQSFANLMRFLQNMNGPGAPGPVIRPGGSSADTSEWLPTPAECANRPPNVTYCINASDLAAYAQAVPLWNGKITLDVSFRSPNDTAPSVAHAVAAVAALGWERLEAISIGNEPDGYATSWGPHFRPPGWNYSLYAGQIGAYIDALTTAGVLPPIVNGTSVGAPRLQAADYCCEAPFLNAWPALLDTFGPTLHSASQHRYPGVNGHAGEDTLAWLLSTNGTVFPAAVVRGSGCLYVCTSAFGHWNTTPAVQVAPWAAQAAQQGFQFVIGEGNSINGGGLPNASNVFGSALWAADILFNMAAVGVSHWDFHGGPGGWYAAITYSPPYTINAPPEVHPLFYGIWLFSDAAANASVLVDAGVQSTNPLIVTWATHSNATEGGDVWKVVVIHKDLLATTNATVYVSLPAANQVATLAGGRSHWQAKPETAIATLRILTAAGGPYATEGVTFGGQTFDGTPDGSIQGAATFVTVAQDAQGRFSFELSHLTAGLLTITVPHQRLPSL